ncbi:membrane protein insertion efficiency factor YidD [Dermatobacter hominis]|uniref:membrane protein insertion efficiency factor YidD n=1 Tax=Dermatobacter hominis TaxID=2884263 RepID=UPI001D11A553|nr:membrane protein insertion efficiency factor YidD [Dermatobacter hominis]UDY34347.1 membrane protein insertion efficiency factor YidD [Dermatobacter hominis]
MTGDAVAHRPSLAARGLTGVVRVYQHAAAGRPSPCRHVPSCSTYAVEALEAHGAVRGSWLAVRRLGRCHPWGTSGYDPVPPRRGAVGVQPRRGAEDVSGVEHAGPQER